MAWFFTAARVVAEGGVLRCRRRRVKITPINTQVVAFLPENGLFSGADLHDGETSYVLVRARDLLSMSVDGNLC